MSLSSVKLRRVGHIVVVYDLFFCVIIPPQTKWNHHLRPSVKMYCKRNS